MNKTTITLTLVILTFTMLFYSCGDNPQKTAADNKFGSLKVEIPESLKDKPEVVTYIHNMSRVADDYALLIDEVLEGFGGFNDKDIENMGMMDKIKLMKATAEVGFKSIDMMSKWGEYHNQLDIFKEDLTEDETLALEAVMQRFEERMKQIEKKHAKFFKDE